MFELRHLAALDAIATEGTFGRAATRLGYTQSTLSQQIAALERAVGGPVFDRPGGPRPARITPLGRVVLEHARTMLAAADAAGEDIARFHAGGGRVDVGTFQTVTNVLLPPVVAALRSDHPDCDIRLVEDETETPTLAGLDLMFFDGPGAPDLDRVRLLADEHVLVAPRAMFRASRVAVDRLDGVPMIGLPPICDQRRVEDQLADLGVRPRFVFRTADNQAVVSMVRGGLGCAVLPLLATGSARSDDQVTLHRLRPALPPREVYLLWQGTLSPLAARLRDLSVAAARDLTSSGACRL
ncbi:LysR family transcriptional regulator [Nocardioides immobilis]|uniref:LysR family transcriptional regulator n=1 Tax=Nocardioides immobilis TaxID=2049295 RepID=A0A417XTU5_9ACTN|nr:LysR family transcriptional regulator [Nocardioides immobilis]RHW23888.1 LysR family transcriptional regulator [Nocardioides immobilis]